jgi:hypothetical protein
MGYCTETVLLSENTRSADGPCEPRAHRRIHPVFTTAAPAGLEHITAQTGPRFSVSRFVRPTATDPGGDVSLCRIWSVKSLLSEP